MGMAVRDRIAEAFEDLATEVTAEIIINEDFLELNPSVTALSNLSPFAEARVLRDFAGRISLPAGNILSSTAANTGERNNRITAGIRPEREAENERGGRGRRDRLGRR